MAVCDLCCGDGFIAQGDHATECPKCIGTGEIDEDELDYPPDEKDDDEASGEEMNV